MSYISNYFILLILYYIQVKCKPNSTIIQQYKNINLYKDQLI